MGVDKSSIDHTVGVSILAEYTRTVLGVSILAEYTRTVLGVSILAEYIRTVYWELVYYLHFTPFIN